MWDLYVGAALISAGLLTIVAFTIWVLWSEQESRR